ncbi:hypothetical protein CRG98_004949 [Punica granatum]|uniref:Uncharacterized protein n=1 Tax=Punica granatum TaxID=22663 RepID=A0A2I0L1N4_PUNGR|nr:hypothetical protein CRG98_004949 [Punica granatum]
MALLLKLRDVYGKEISRQLYQLSSNPTKVSVSQSLAFSSHISASCSRCSLGFKRIPSLQHVVQYRCADVFLENPIRIGSRSSYSAGFWIID